MTAEDSSMYIYSSEDRAYDSFWRAVHNPMADEHIAGAILGRDRIPFQAVKVYSGLGLVVLKGKTFKMNLNNVKNVRTVDDFMNSIRRAVAFKLCKVSPCPVRAGSSGPPVAVAGRFGMYTLFFGSTWKGRVALFQNWVLIEKWMPGLKTVDAWVVYVQRRVRRARRTRRALALAMAMHARLGEGAGLAGLGEDVLAKICQTI